MSVLLGTSRGLPGLGSYAAWASVGPPPAGLERGRERAAIAADLEAAFDAEAPAWWTLARDVLGKDASAVLGHTPACAANVSDFGVMLAWIRLLGTWAGEDETTLVIVDDPWLFRQVAAQSGVRTVAAAPSLWRARLGGFIRGYAARSLVAVRAFGAALLMRRCRGAGEEGGAALLVYGHPRSKADGEDAYFGSLMGQLPGLRRVLHVDCPATRARKLAGPGTTSLHAWGSPLFAWCLPFARWRPGRAAMEGPLGWLVKRAAEREGGTGQGAMIRWQIHCQERWFRRTGPSVVAWPWENHAWERCLARAARRAGVCTVGYAHVPVHARELNYAADGDPRGEDALPDTIACSGPAARDMLAGMGHRPDRLVMAGALRFPDPRPLHYDPAGPVFVALPAVLAVAREMIEAVRPLATKTRRFLIKDHPLTPIAFETAPGIERTTTPLDKQPGISAVIYASTTLGLEALMGGLPTLRFLPRRTIVQGPPEGLSVAPVDTDSAGLSAALDGATPAPALDPGEVFAPPDVETWRRLLRMP